MSTGQRPAFRGSATQTAASSWCTARRAGVGSLKNIWQTAVTWGFHSTTSRELRVCFRQKRVSEPAPSPSRPMDCSRGGSRKSSQAIICEVYSSTSSAGFLMRMAPCIHSLPKCR